MADSKPRTGTINRGKKREEKMMWEMDTYAAKINRILQDDPLVQHLLPINPGGEDLAEKIRDGLLLSAFINKIPGFGELINTKKLHKVSQNPDGTYDKLNMFQIAQNQDMMLQAARFIGLNVENIGVMDLIESKKHKHLVVKLLQEIMTFDGMERLADAAKQYDTTASTISKGDGLGESGNSRKADSIRTLSLSKGKKGRDNSALLKKFLNEILQEAGSDQKVNSDIALSEAMSDSKIYLTILHHLDAKLCLLDPLNEDDPLDRASAVIEYLSKLGLGKDFQNYDIVYGEDDIHIQIVASIATLAASIRLQRINLPSEEAKKPERIRAESKTPSDPSEVENLPPAQRTKLTTKEPELSDEKDHSTEDFDVGGTADSRILQSIYAARKEEMAQKSPPSDDDIVIISPPIKEVRFKTDSDNEDSVHSVKLPAHKEPESNIQPPVVVEVDPENQDAEEEQKLVEVTVKSDEPSQKDQEPEPTIQSPVLVSSDLPNQEIKEEPQDKKEEEKPLVEKDPEPVVQPAVVVDLGSLNAEAKQDPNPSEGSVSLPENKEEENQDRKKSESFVYDDGKDIPQPSDLVGAGGVESHTDDVDEPETGPIIPVSDVIAGNTEQDTDATTTTIDIEKKKRKQLKWAIIFTFFFAVIFLILGSIATVVAEKKINGFITNYAPLHTSTGTFAQFQSRTKSRSYYVFNYKNVNSFSSLQPFQIEQIGPIIFKEEVVAYNTTFKKSENLNPSRSVLQYMSRSKLVLENADQWKSQYVVVPAVQYVGAVSSDYFNEFIADIPNAVASLFNYYSGNTLSTQLSQLLIPAYLKYVQGQSVNVNVTLSKWCATDDVVLKDNRTVISLPFSIPLAAGRYLFDPSETYSIRRFSLSASTSGGVPAWLNAKKSYDSAILSALQSQNLSLIEAQLTMVSVRAWMESVTSYSRFLIGVKSQLSEEPQVGLSSTDAADIQSLEDLGLYQLASAKLINYIGGTESIVDLPTTFSSVSFPFERPFEIGTYLTMYSSALTGISLSEAKQFRNVFTNVAYVGSFLATVTTEGFLGFTGEYLSNITAAGISASNAEATASFLKHVGKMYYFSRNGLGILRSSPTTSTDAGLFIKVSVYDLFSGYLDPNLKGNLSNYESYPNPIIRSFESNDAHWNSHKNEWNQIMTGTDSLTDVYKAAKVDGITAIRGIWSTKETISSNAENVALEPFHRNDPLSSFSKWDKNLARTVSYSKTEKGKHKVFDVYKYKPSHLTFQSQSSNAANSKYFMNGPNGLVNMANYFKGAEVWISKPHLDGVDDSVKSAFSSGSLESSSSSHDSYLDVESWSGSIMSGSEKYQVNVRLTKADWFNEPGYLNLFESRSNDLYLPVFWADESFSIPDSRYNDLYNGIYIWNNGALIFTIVFLILGIILFCVGLFLVYKWTKTGNADKSNAQLLRILYRS